MSRAAGAGDGAGRRRIKGGQRGPDEVSPWAEEGRRRVVASNWSQSGSSLGQLLVKLIPNFAKAPPPPKPPRSWRTIIARCLVCRESLGRAARNVFRNTGILYSVARPAPLEPLAAPLAHTTGATRDILINYYLSLGLRGEGVII